VDLSALSVRRREKSVKICHESNPNSSFIQPIVHSLYWLEVSWIMCVQYYDIILMYCFTMNYLIILF
jgi:hypothetical protein